MAELPQPDAAWQRGKAPRPLRQRKSVATDALRLPIVAECNLDCGLCTTPEDAGLNDAQVQALLRGGLRGGRKVAVFTGGEPTLSEKLEGWLRAAKREGFEQVGLESNALRFSAPGYASSLVEAGLDFVLVHFPSSRPAIYDALTGRAGLFAAALRGVRALVAAGVRVELNHPLTEQTAPLLSELVAFAAAHLPGIALINVGVAVGGAEDGELIRELAPLRAELNQARAAAQKLGVHLALSGELQVTEAELPNVNRVLRVSTEGFYRDPHSGELRHEIDLRITLECNQYCHFCLVGDRDNENVSRAIFDQLDALAPRFRSGELYRLTITGGEPTIVRALPDYVRYARAAGIERINLQTNAMKLARQSYAQSLFDAGVEALFISLHSHEPEISDAITVCPGGLERTLAGIEVAQRVGFRIYLNCVINEMNYAGLPEYVRFVHARFQENQRNPIELGFSYVGTMGDAMRNLWVVPSFEDTRGPVKEALEWCVERGIRIYGFTGNCGTPPCFLDADPRFFTDIRPVQPEERTGSHVYVEACDSCALKDSCYGVRKEYLTLHGPAGLRPIPAED